jgi:hypothetical protein
MHVDDFVDSFETDKYVSWFFFLHRLPAILQCKFKGELDKVKLFCTYEGERYRVTGASRFGDIYLMKDFKKDRGYELRVDLEKCSAWGRTAKKGKSNAN